LPYDTCAVALAQIAAGIVGVIFLVKEKRDKDKDKESGQGRHSADHLSA
jgi:hypothetical protein